MTKLVKSRQKVNDKESVTVQSAVVFAFDFYLNPKFIL